MGNIDYKVSLIESLNKEEIQYKVMIGDTTNLSEDEKLWFFHTDDPATDDHVNNLNPHFDSLDGLELTEFFTDDPDGLDCVLEMTCGPFSLEVGEQVPFSFCIIFGQDEEDLINNARFAQVMYNSRYQGFTPPTRPTAHAETEKGSVKLYWDDIAESSIDVVTGYSDFEGYKIYRSVDGGETWGKPNDIIYDQNGIFVGWHPYAQFDLSAKRDSIHCAYSNDTLDCAGDPTQQRGHSIRGQDPYFPWFNLGNDTGLTAIRLPEPHVVLGDTFWYMYEDENVVDGLEYTYSVVAYDMGLEPPYQTSYEEQGNGQYEMVVDTNFSNPDKWGAPDGYASIENSKGTTVLDRNFIQVHPGVTPATDLSNVGVVPNPYVSRSGFNETEHLRKIRFTNLTERCTIKIFTLTGEHINTIEHENQESGNAWWDMRTVNNQEVSPGLYIFHVEQNGSEHSKDYVGKFAVIR